MNLFCLFAILSSIFLFSYRDVELERLWSAIEDIGCPTLEDYILVENYLTTGERPYLDALRCSDQIEVYRGRMRSIENFRLIGPENREPIFDRYTFNMDGSSEKKRCILLYSSSNGIYPKKAKKLLGEIEQCGYQGHVLLRIGGFPNTPFGGLKICHVPYAFKVAFLQEARIMGFKEVLWIDLAIHPLKDFESVFREISQKGYFFTNVGSLQDNAASHLPAAAQALQIPLDLYDRIPHLSSSMIGLNMENSRSMQLLEMWYRDTEEVYPCMTWWPEELSLSAAAWRLGCPPSIGFGTFVCGESEQFQLENRPDVQFYLDEWR